MERDIEETEELVVREPNGWKILKKRPPVDRGIPAK